MSFYNPDEISQSFFGVGAQLGGSQDDFTAQNRLPSTMGRNLGSPNRGRDRQTRGRVLPDRRRSDEGRRGFGGAERSQYGKSQGGLWRQAQENVPVRESVLGFPILFGSRLPGRGFGANLKIPPRYYHPDKANRPGPPPMGDKAAIAARLGDLLAQAALARPDIDPRSGLPLDQRVINPPPGRYAGPTPQPEIINILADMAQQGELVGDVTKIGRT